MAEKRGQIVDLQKRVKMSKVKQQMIAIVLLTSMAFGVAIVLILRLVRLIRFDVAVLEAKGESVTAYEKAIKNIGLCKDKNNDGKYSKEELDSCDPDALTAEEMPNSLRYSVMVDLANNRDLEAVGRASLDGCFDSATKKKRDFYSLYRDAKTDDDRIEYFGMMKMCSSLRTIPDALPATQNVEALMSSLNQIFVESNWEPESLSPSQASQSDEDDALADVSKIPVNFAVEARGELTMKVLTNVEKSIRTFDITSAEIAWNENGLDLRVVADAYYTENAELGETMRTVTMAEVEKSNKKKEQKKEEEQK